MRAKFYSQYISEVFVLYRGQQLDEVVPKIEVKTEILPLLYLDKKVTEEIIKLQGYFSFAYLRLFYGSPETFLGLAWVGEKPALIEWAIPSRKLRHRYPFLPEKAYVLVDSYIAPQFVDDRIHLFLLQQIISSLPASNEYWVLVNEKHLASIRGIEKAGAKHVGRYVRKRWLWGCLRSTKYHPDEA